MNNNNFVEDNQKNNENNNNVGLLVAEDEFIREDSQSDSTGSIPIPKYFKDSVTTKVIEYR